MMYRVIRLFTDLQDDGHKYSVGDTYPRRGVVATGERIAELASDKNRQGVPLIEEITETVPETAAEVAAEDTVEDEVPDIERKPKRKKRGE